MSKHDLMVIGAGPGGYVAAIRAAQLGFSVGVIEKESVLGGTCLRVGCIPSKALLESSEQFHAAQHSLKDHGVVCDGVQLDLAAMLKRKDKVVESLTKGVAALFKKNKITSYQGTARFKAADTVTVSNGDETQELSAPRILIASGSRVADLPGVERDGERIVSSTEGLAFDAVPEKLIVIGAGYIGLELGSVWNRLGSDVTVLEYLDRILPGMDAELAGEAQKLFKRQGLTFKLGTKVTGAKVKGKQVSVEIEGGKPLTADRVLVAVGRTPNTAELNLDAVGITCDGRGRIPVDDDFKTNVDGVYAIGDVIRGPMLAHKAEEEGIACIEKLVTGHGHIDYNSIPGIVYTHPEIAGVGQTEEQLNESGTPYRKGVFFFRGNGRARALGEVDGKVKLLAHEQTDRLLGVHIIGPRAGDLIAEAAVALAFGASSEDLARASHAHPTLAECLKEAALAVDDRAIHA